MSTYVNIGSTPADEECVQVGSPDYSHRSRKECTAYIHQLRRQFGPEPDGALLTTKSFAHDFGTYREVVCYYDENIAESVEYAFKVENGSPARWDEEAEQELDQ